MNYYDYEGDKLGFDSFDRSGETYCCNSISSASSTNAFTAGKGIKIGAIYAKDGDNFNKIATGVETLSDKFDSFSKKIADLGAQLCDVYSSLSSIDERLNFLENKQSYKIDIQHVNRSMFKTLRYSGR